MNRAKKNEAGKITPIYSFFPKSKAVGADIPENAKDFYQQHLPKKSQKSTDFNSSVEECVKCMPQIKVLKEQLEQIKSENLKLTTENQKLRNDFAGLLKVHKETCRLYVNKDLKVKVLEKKIIPQAKVLYDTFKSDLGETVLIQLRKLKANKASDSTFILNCIRGLFKDPADLILISACGKSQNSTLPPKKREIIDSIFLERLTSENIDDSERSARYLRINRLINNAIGNILRPSVIYFYYNGNVQFRCTFQKKKKILL